MKQRTAVWIVALVATALAGTLQWGCNRSPEPAANPPAAAPPLTPEGTAAPAQAAPEPPAAPAAQPAAPPPAAAGSKPQASRPSAPAPAPAAAPRPATPPPAPAPPPPPRRFTLRAGSPISVFTTSELSTKTNATGDRFTATLAKPIVDDDWVVAKQGARVEGTIVESDPGGRVKGVASMTIKLTKLTLADGRSIELQTNTIAQEAKTTKGKDAARVGIASGVGAAIGAIAGGGKGAAIGAAVGGGAGATATLATRGESATIPSESELTFSLEAPISVTQQP